jgi:hypothetical protein
MGWKQLRSRLAAISGFGPEHETNPSPHFPIQVEIVPAELSATIYIHTIDRLGDSIPCWSYVTTGLAAHNQCEVIFTLKRESAESLADYPLEPLEFFGTLLDLVKEGRSVAAGGYSIFGIGGLLGFPGVAYTAPGWLPPGVTSSGGWLAIIALTMEESDALLEFGPTRILSILGGAERFYPVPFWTDRRRQSRISPEEMKQSILTTVPCILGSGFTVFRESDRIVLRAHQETVSKTLESLSSLPADSCLALTTAIDPGADGALMWRPGQGKFEAITPPGSQGLRLCGSFVLFIPEQGADESQVVEDGYTLYLTSQSWNRLRNAILSQQCLEMPAFELRWIPAGLEEYLPRPLAEAPMRNARVRLKTTTLLQPQEMTASAVEIKELAEFINAIKGLVEVQFSHGSISGPLRIRILLRPVCEAKYELDLEPAPDDTPLQRLREELKRRHPPVVTDPVGLDLEFEISN